MAEFWHHNGFITDAKWRNVIPVNFSVKQVPDDLAARLRERARRNHRSLQGELMAILEDAAGPPTLTLEEADRRIKALGHDTPDESTAWIRELRDAR